MSKKCLPILCTYDVNGTLLGHTVYININKYKDKYKFKYPRSSSPFNVCTCYVNGTLLLGHTVYINIHI